MGRRSVTRRLTTLGCLVVCLLTACWGNKVYNQYQQIPIAGWERNDTLTFCIPPVAEDGLYNIDLGLRTTGSYPFQGLTLIVEHQVIGKHQSGTLMKVPVDTVSCKLIDSRGHAKGHGVNYMQSNFHVTTLSLHAGDSLRVNVRHDMKREILPGISDLGVDFRLLK
ncbi:MAG: gliding motility lipoprotein GldH [Prevotella sp.]|nr:gliding motility lipoprotein GldH [Prevotella sp.]